MTTNEPADTEQPWGAQPPAPAAPQRPRWSGKKTAVAVAIAIAIAGGGGVAIYAATANDSATQQAGPGGGMGQRGGPAALADALHGEFVVADGSTELLQNGQVTSISDTSITVQSSDDYTKTYTIDSSTVQAAGIQTGGEVTVIAKQSGTAISISQPMAMRSGDGRPGQQQLPAPTR